MSRNTPQFHRRGFLKTALSAGAALMAPQFIPSSALGSETLHDVRFFVDRDFLVDFPGWSEFAVEEELGRRLKTYLVHWNAILAKSTSLVLANFTPKQDCWLVDGMPPQYVTDDPLAANYDINFYISKTTQSPYIDGGAGYRTRYASTDEWTVRLAWHKIWTAAQRSSNDPAYPDGGNPIKMEYAYQSQVALHEMAHAYGVGFSEYYSTTPLLDATGTLPDATECVSWTPPAGSYWESHQDVLHDPMMGGNPSNDVFEYQDWASFCELSAYHIDIDRPSQLLTRLVPAQQPISVQVVDSVGSPIPNAAVRQYRMSKEEGEFCGSLSSLRNVAEPLVEEKLTDSSGMAGFTWPCIPENVVPCNPYNRGQSGQTQSNMCLFEASRFGYATTKAWLTVFDMEAGLYVPGGGVAGSYRYPGKLTIQLPTA